MSAPAIVAEFKFRELGRLRDVLELIGHIRQIQEPITSPSGLRQAIELCFTQPSCWAWATSSRAGSGRY
jgi:hypothetical protein